MSGITAPGDDARSGPKLAYMVIADDIASQIQAGKLKPGDRLRSERDLAEHYGMAYSTVRKALGILRERGLILSVHGRGTYIA